MTTIAALQCVEKGLVKLDEDLSPIIKEFQDLQIVSFAEGSDEPAYKKAEKKITLRLVTYFLLTTCPLSVRKGRGKEKAVMLILL